MLHGAGIFTYRTGWFLGQRLANIPAPWSIWVWLGIPIISQWSRKNIHHVPDMIFPSKDPHFPQVMLASLLLHIWYPKKISKRVWLNVPIEIITGNKNTQFLQTKPTIIKCHQISMVWVMIGTVILVATSPTINPLSSHHGSVNPES